MQFNPPILRDYQTQQVIDARAAIADGYQSVLIQGSTGSGKTETAVFMAGEAVQAGLRVLYIVNRKELVRDVESRLKRSGIPCGILMAAQTRDLDSPVIVASVDTLHRRKMKPDAQLVIVDEAHVMVSERCQDILKHYRATGATIFPMTATPVRLDGKGLRLIADEMVLGPTTAELVRLGKLVPPRVFAGLAPDLGKVRVVGGDYNEGQLERVANSATLRGNIVETWLRLAKDRSTVAFCVTKDHARDLAAAFELAGIKAISVTDETPYDQRKQIWDALSSGAIRIVTSVGLISYGWDCPPVSCAILARPTKSEALYLQMVGRILRPFLGKTDALVLDHAGNTERHGSVLEERHWTLEDRPAREISPANDVKKCPECGALYTGPVCTECGYAPPKREITTDETVEMVEIPFRPEVRSTVAEDEEYYAKICEMGHSFAIDFGTDKTAQAIVTHICKSGYRVGAIYYQCQELQYLRAQHLKSKGCLPPVRDGVSAIRQSLPYGFATMPKGWKPDVGQRVALRYPRTKEPEPPARLPDAFAKRSYRRMVTGVLQ